MAKIDLEKVLIALLDSPFNKQFDDKVKDALKEQCLEYKDGEIVESQKPKFHEGEWLCENEPNNYARFIQILKTSNAQGKERYRISRDIHNDEDIVEFDYVEKYYHKFDIKDAKEGDVLCDYCEAWDNPLIFVLKKFEYVNFGLVRPSDYSSYCYLTAGDRQRFKEGTYHHKHNIKPATKEQRDLLFQKMKEAGYEWDADKKELKKIDRTKDLSNYIKFLKTFHCWSKEQREIMDKYLEEQIKKDYSPIDSRFDYEHANIQQKDYSPEEDEELFFGDFRKTDSEDKGKASFTNRQVYNRAILKVLSDYVEKYPDIRFVEMLCNLGFYLDYMEESQVTYLDLNKTINKQNHE